MKPGLVPGFLCLLITACGGGVPLAVEHAGTIRVPEVVEASGLAASSRSPELLWLLNDGGSGPSLYAIDTTGRSRGRLTVESAQNVDWEDLASFSLHGDAYLLIADIGDNEAKRDFVSLYVVVEPENLNDVQNVQPQRRIDFRYPDGPRDAEAIVVDAANQRALILSKRDIPAVFYAVALEPQAADIVTAQRLGPNGSLPPPRQDDVDNAVRRQNWHWQPTAMDIAADDGRIAILTYRAAYVFSRVGTEDWMRTLRRDPSVYPIGRYKEAEAIAFSRDGESLYVTVEAKQPPLLRIELAQER